MHTPSKSTNRIAIPVVGNSGLESKVSDHFGRSPGFITVERDGSDCRYLDSRESRRAAECAPIEALVHDGVHFVLCHSMGRGALVRTHNAGLQIYQTHGGQTVAQALKDFKAGSCQDLPDSALCQHHTHEGNDDCHPHHE